MGVLSARVVPVSDVSDEALRRMYALFERYYTCTSFEAFVEDFRAKDAVILLSDGEIQGFSTLQEVRIEVDGRVHVGMFSGDTVVDRAWWGTKVLGRAFLWHLLKRRLRHLFRPYWWILISKGYKTYLLMANNFPEHHPNADGPSPPDRLAIRDAFAVRLFGRWYDPARGVVAFEQSRGQLRQGIADVTPALVAQNPRVALFERLNPTWREGTELVCLAAMPWLLPVHYVLKAWRTRRGPRAAAEPA